MAEYLGVDRDKTDLSGGHKCDIQVKKWNNMGYYILFRHFTFHSVVYSQHAFVLRKQGERVCSFASYERDRE